MRTLIALAFGTIVLAGWSGSESIADSSGLIAFATEKPERIYVMNADGSNRRVLTTARQAGLWNDACCSWSPDGNRFAYVASSGDFMSTDVYVISPTGEGKRRLTRTKGGEYSPVWSPDGRKIAFDHYVEPLEVPQAYVANADGSKPRPLGTAKRPQPVTRPVPLRTVVENTSLSPSFGRDSSRVAFVGIAWQHQIGIYTRSVDGRSMVRLAQWSSRGNYPSVSWSPNGRMIAVLDDDDLWLVNTDGSQREKVLASAGRATSKPVWSPDGTMLAFSRGDGDWEVFVMNADGSRLRKLTDNAGHADECPSWSPDGRSLAFTSTRDGNPEIYVTSIDGRTARRLTRTPDREVCPAWSPAR